MPQRSLLLLQIISPPRRTLFPEQSKSQSTGETVIVQLTYPAPMSKRCQTGTALKHCREAFQRAYSFTLAKLNESDTDECDEFLAAAKDAGAQAYCNALPVLLDQEGIRNYIACVAHGVLIGAISEEKSRQLLYAAQVANATNLRQPKPSKAAKNTSTPPPSPPE